MPIKPLVRAAACGALLLLAAPAAAGAAAPAWWSYDRPALTTQTVHRQLAVPMRDGVSLGCDLHLPARGGRALPGRFPSVIYEVGPYAAATPVFYVEQGEYFAARGYSAITCNVRGTGRSGGSFPQVSQPADQLDAYDLVEWVASQDWSTGRVGQTGASYAGMTTYRAAAAQPPHLVAIASQQSWNDLYLDDVYPGGVPSTPATGNNWPLIAQTLSLGRVDAGRLFASYRHHPTRDAFWQQIAIDGILDRVQVPTLAFSGWQDPLFRDGALRNYERLIASGAGEHTWLIAGPWSHGEVVGWKGCRLIAAACGGTDLVPRGALLAWFDHWVAQRPQAPLPSARVTSYQGPAGVGAGWQERDTPFPAGVSNTSLALTTGSTLDASPGVASTKRWIADPLDGLTRAAPQLTFTSAPSAAPVDLAGRPLVRLLLTSSSSDANLYAELREIRADGRATTISEGWLRASHRASHEHPEPLIPSQPTALSLQLEPLDLRLHAGSRLALRLSSGSALQVAPIPRRTQVTVATGTGGSTLELQTAK